MGKSTSAPPTPDYTGAAKQQGKDNLTAAREQNVMSNPNMVTPFGNQTVTFSSPTVDQNAYQAAVDKYNQGGGINKSDYYTTTGGGGSGEGSDAGTSVFNQAAYDKALAGRVAPRESDYMTGGGQPTVTQTLTPQAQQTLDSQMRVQTALANLGETGIGNAQATLSKPFVPTTTAIQHDFGDPNSFNAQSELDTSNIAAMPINAGMKAQKLIM
jgi:hypothetical protein